MVRLWWGAGNVAPVRDAVRRALRGAVAINIATHIDWDSHRHHPHVRSCLFVLKLLRRLADYRDLAFFVLWYVCGVIVS